jgi:hypothetical protein
MGLQGLFNIVVGVIDWSKFGVVDNQGASY